MDSSITAFDNKPRIIKEKKSLISKVMDVGSISDRKLYLRADKIDLKTYEGVESVKKQIRRLWTDKKEEWEIDPSKLDLRHVLAKGTYSTVYRGVYGDQDVAVKILDWDEDSISSAAETTNVWPSFSQEVSVWRKLDHPNITKFIGASVTPSKVKIPSKDPGSINLISSKACCVVVEYLQGGTLKNYLIRKRREKLPMKTVVQLSLDLARGLSYLHSKNIVHRDIKSENVLLDSHRTLKIADFGVARVEAENPQDMTGKTGTVRYMAPEVIEAKPYNRKCDVYSFGICLWEIYCCQMPYGDLAFIDLSTGVVRKNLRPKIPRCCPSSFAAIMKKCWDANPEKRPEMDEVVRMLEAIDTSKGGGMIAENKASSGCFCFFQPRGP